MKNSAFIALLATLAACSTNTKKECCSLTESGLSKEKFQTEIEGKKTDLIVLKNENNMEVCITNFGGRIVSAMVPDKEGNFKDVVLGFDNIEDYINVPSDFGASIGRYANRIGKELFEGFTSNTPLTIPMYQTEGELLAQDGDGSVTVLATKTLPYTMTNTYEFAAIHSNPPGIYTDKPAVDRKSVV